MSNNTSAININVDSSVKKKQRKLKTRIFWLKVLIIEMI